MIRVALVLLLLAACALILALWRDWSGPRSQRTARLRSAFLHGAPLAVPARPANQQEVVAGQGQLRLRLPASWVADGGATGGLSYRDRSSDARTLRLELQTSSAPEPVGQQQLARSFEALLPQDQRSLEELPNGNLLMRWIETKPDAGRELAVYCWRLGRLLPPHEVRSAVFRLVVALEQAEDVVVRSDLAALEREIRIAQLS